MIMTYTTTIDQAESVARFFGLRKYKTQIIGGESIIIVDKKTCLRICRSYNTVGHQHGRDGKYALTNLGKFLYPNSK